MKCDRCGIDIDDDAYCVMNVDGTVESICEDCDCNYVFCDVHGYYHYVENDIHPCRYLLWSEVADGWIGAGNVESPDNARPGVRMLCDKYGSRFASALRTAMLRSDYNGYHSSSCAYNIEIDNVVYEIAKENDDDLIGIDWISTLEVGVTREAELRTALWVAQWQTRNCHWVFDPRQWQAKKGFSRILRNLKYWLELMQSGHRINRRAFWAFLSQNCDRYK